MINLWFDESVYSGPVRGPYKVIVNLIESLEHTNVPYSINEDKYDYNYLVHYGREGHNKHEKLEHDSCVIGPQIWPFDVYGQFLKNNPQYYRKLIVPSISPKLSFIDQGFVPEKISVWPVGIKDINIDRKGNKFLVYQKQRSDEDVKFVIEFLEKEGYEYETLYYEHYNQNQFYSCLESCSRAIIVGRPETQGIAYQEMMSSNMPLLLWDVKEWYDYGVPEPYQKYPEPTLAHYFSDECGLKFYSKEEFEEAFDTFVNTTYTPKDYVNRELSYSVSVKRLLSLFEE
jgi:hypothetical protein